MKSLNIPNWTRKIEWSDYKDPKELPSSKSWSRSSLPPQENELRIVYVPEKTVTTDPFYGIFEPGNSFFNGWGDFPEEIDLHRIYEAQIIETLFEDEQGKWAKVRIIDSVKWSDLEVFLDSHYSTDVFFIRNYRYGDYSQYQKWLFVSLDGNVGYELVFYEDGEYFTLVYECFLEEITIHNIKYKKETIQSEIKRHGGSIFKYES
jgi:hypothetical protein